MGPLDVNKSVYKEVTVLLKVILVVGSHSDNSYMSLQTALLSNMFAATVCINRAFYGGLWRTLQCLCPAFITGCSAVFTGTERHGALWLSSI